MIQSIWRLMNSTFSLSRTKGNGRKVTFSHEQCGVWPSKKSGCAKGLVDLNSVWRKSLVGLDGKPELRTLYQSAHDGRRVLRLLYHVPKEKDVLRQQLYQKGNFQQFFWKAKRRLKSSATSEAFSGSVHFLRTAPWLSCWSQMSTVNPHLVRPKQLCKTRQMLSLVLMNN